MSPLIRNRGEKENRSVKHGALRLLSNQTTGRLNPTTDLAAVAFCQQRLFLFSGDQSRHSSTPILIDIFSDM